MADLRCGVCRRRFRDGEEAWELRRRFRDGEEAWELRRRFRDGEEAWEQEVLRVRIVGKKVTHANETVLVCDGCAS